MKSILNKSKQIRYNAFALMVALTTLFASCEKTPLTLFEEPASAYFLYQENPALYNSLRGYTTVKFTYVVGDIDTVRLPVYVLGKLTDYDRPLNVAMAIERTTATENVHYRILHDLSYIPANERFGYATIVALRAEEIAMKREVNLGVRLLPNEHFSIAFDSVMNNSTERIMRSVLDFNILISDTLTRPAVWTNNDHTQSHWGEYSEVKYRLILREDIGGIPACFWDAQCSFEGRHRVFPADVEPVAFRLRYFLQQYYCENDREPMRDENGRSLNDVIDFYQTLNNCEMFAAPPKEPIQIITLNSKRVNK